MRALSLAFVSVVLVPVALAAACGNDGASRKPDARDASISTTPAPMPTPPVACPPCTTDDDCGGATCTQLGADSYCAPACSAGGGCAADRACVPASSISGQQVSVCVPRGDVCGEPAAVTDGGTTVDRCGSLVGPKVAATCASCTGRPDCQSNGCYGGWWCDTATSRCQAPPSDCGSVGSFLDAGAPVTGTVTANGGSVSRLLFAVVGDTRPASIDDTAGYPGTIIDTIYDRIQAFQPRPAFVVATGDYLFASSFGAASGPQLDRYLAAKNRFLGTTFPAMGNHECTGATASNCGVGAANGTTNNYAAFLSKMLAPIGKTEPWYAISIDALDASWTAKLVFVAANAWSDAQASWLASTLARPTTYTFVVRHESHDASTAPGVTPSEAIMAQHPYTLAIVGHTHTYGHYGGREVIIGNGGAPISGSKNYGFGVFGQRPDGAIQVDMIDYASGVSDTKFRFAVKADGSPAP